MKKIIIFMIIVSGLFYLSSCPMPEGCFDEVHTQGFQYITVFYTNNISNFDSTTMINGGLEPNDVVGYNYLGISILMQGWGNSCNNYTSGNVENILVICNEDYNENYKKGDTINDMVIYTSEFYQYQKLLLDSLVNRHPKIHILFYLFLKEAPSSTHLNSFTIEYFEEGGIHHTGTTEKIYITP